MVQQKVTPILHATMIARILKVSFQNVKDILGVIATVNLVTCLEWIKSYGSLSLLGVAMCRFSIFCYLLSN